MTDKLRQELADLRSRLKTQAEWSSAQDMLEQKAIAARIRLIQSHLERPEGKPR